MYVENKIPFIAKKLKKDHISKSESSWKSWPYFLLTPATDVINVFSTTAEKYSYYF